MKYNNLLNSLLIKKPEKSRIIIYFIKTDSLRYNKKKHNTQNKTNNYQDNFINMRTKNTKYFIKNNKHINFFKKSFILNNNHSFFSYFFFTLIFLTTLFYFFGLKYNFLYLNNNENSNIYRFLYLSYNHIIKRITAYISYINMIKSPNYFTYIHNPNCFNYLNYFNHVMFISHINDIPYEQYLKNLNQVDYLNDYFKNMISFILMINKINNLNIKEAINLNSYLIILLNNFKNELKIFQFFLDYNHHITEILFKLKNKFLSYFFEFLSYLNNQFSLNKFKLSCLMNKFTLLNNKIYYDNNTTIKVFFCPHQLCEEHLLSLLMYAKTASCAFYDLTDKKVFKIIILKNISTIIYKKNYNKLIKLSNDSLLFQKLFRSTKSNSVMHDKFCIINNSVVVTGSANPTYNGLFRNNNNIVIIKSKMLAENYLKEFNDIKTTNNLNEYKNKKNHIYHILKTNNGLIFNYFCPQDNCREKVLNEIKNANHSIFFMTFSFTDKKIAKTLEQLSNLGLNITGIFEKREINRYSVYHFFMNNKCQTKIKGFVGKNNSYYKRQRTYDKNLITICNDTNPYSMHNKIFIIDKKIVITGSYNPTINGAYHNYENIIIIKNKTIAKQYLNEFKAIYKNSKCQRI